MSFVKMYVCVGVCVVTAVAKRMIKELPCSGDDDVYALIQGLKYVATYGEGDPHLKWKLECTGTATSELKLYY